jgi:hypothetical protein
MQAPINGADIYAMQSGVTGHVLAYDETDMGMFSSPDESIDAISNPSVFFGQRVFFSLESGSPTLLANAWSGADVLSVVVGSPGTLVRAISSSALGLIPADDLDGLAIFGMEHGGDGVVDPFDPAEGGLVYFTVSQLSVGEIGSDVRQRSLSPGLVAGDIYLSGTAGGHTLLHKGDGRLLLFQNDVTDALKLGSEDPLDPFPMYGLGFPDPGLRPQKPPNCPPYRGGGVPIGLLWVEVCDADVPNIVNWEIRLKMCDANGNTMEIAQGGQVKGKASSDPQVKAQMIKDAFESMTFNKPGHDPENIPIFVGVSKFVPPFFVPRPGITGEVCMFVNQDLIDCGWNIDRICFSFSNWTANIIVEPVEGWFPDVKRMPLLQVEGVSESKFEGLLRLRASDAAGNTDPTPATRTWAVPVFPGDDGLLKLHELSDLIALEGGFAPVDADGVMTIHSLPMEPPPTPEGLWGPLVYEAGANSVAGLQVTVGAALARGPGSPCSAVDYAEPFGSLNFLDVSAFLSHYGKGNGAADLVFDGSFNFFDVSKFLELYAQGCP